MLFSCVCPFSIIVAIFLHFRILKAKEFFSQGDTRILRKAEYKFPPCRQTVAINMHNCTSSNLMSCTINLCAFLPSYCTPFIFEPHISLTKITRHINFVFFMFSYRRVNRKSKIFLKSMRSERSSVLQKWRRACIQNNFFISHVHLSLLW